VAGTSAAPKLMPIFELAPMQLIPEPVGIGLWLVTGLVIALWMVRLVKIRIRKLHFVTQLAVCSHYSVLTVCIMTFELRL